MNILITGHTSGIGESLLKIFKSENNVIYGIARNKSKKIKDSNQLAIDLSDINNIKFSSEWASNLKIDTFIHCAGYNPITSLLDATPDIYLKCFNLHFLSAAQITREVIRHKKNSGILKILLISSIWSIISADSRGPDSVSKNCLNTLAKQIAVEHYLDNVQSLSLALGFVETALTELTKNDMKIKNAKDRYLFPNDKIPNSQKAAQIIADITKQDLSMLNGNTLNLDGGIICQ